MADAEDHAMVIDADEIVDTAEVPSQEVAATIADTGIGENVMIVLY